jgi:hypothetical protein
MVTKASFADRQYFNDAQAGQMWRINDPRGGAARELAVEVLRTRTSNEYQLAVAAPYAPASSKKSPVLVVSTDPHPFDAPILPEGFGFAVVGWAALVWIGRRYQAKNISDETEKQPHPADGAREWPVDGTRSELCGQRVHGTRRLDPRARRMDSWAVVVFRTSPSSAPSTPRRCSAPGCCSPPI